MPTLGAERCVARGRESPRMMEAETAELKPEIPDWPLVEREGIPGSSGRFCSPASWMRSHSPTALGDSEPEGYHPALLTE